MFILFNEISDKAESCNNVATLQNIKVEADALKVRCLNEIEKEEAKLIAEEQPISKLQKLKIMLEKQLFHQLLFQK